MTDSDSDTTRSETTRSGTTRPGIGRLRRRAEFLAVAASRRKWVAPGMIVQLGRTPANPAGEIRLGLTASRKVGNAVARNRARRRLRELARNVLPIHAAPGVDLVLIARAETVTRPFADLKKDLETGLRRLGIWRSLPTDPAGRR